MNPSFIKRGHVLCWTHNLKAVPLMKGMCFWKMSPTIRPGEDVCGTWLNPLRLSKNLAQTPLRRDLSHPASSSGLRPIRQTTATTGPAMIDSTLDIFIPRRMAMMSGAFPMAWSRFTSFSEGVIRCSFMGFGDETAGAIPAFTCKRRFTCALPGFTAGFDHRTG